MGRPAPAFWWDHKDDAIIVQSDYDGGECLATFAYIGDASRAIEQADKLIADFVAGRKTPNWGNKKAKPKAKSISTTKLFDGKGNIAELEIFDDGRAFARLMTPTSNGWDGSLHEIRCPPIKIPPDLLYACKDGTVEAVQTWLNENNFKQPNKE